MADKMKVDLVNEIERLLKENTAAPNIEIHRIDFLNISVRVSRQEHLAPRYFNVKVSESV